MRRKSVSVLLCLAILFGVAAVPQVAGASQGGSLSDSEMAHYAQMQADADQSGLLDNVGGSDDSTGTIVLATIGVIALIGVALASP